MLRAMINKKLFERYLLNFGWGRALELTDCKPGHEFIWFVKWISKNKRQIENNRIEVTIVKNQVKWTRTEISSSKVKVLQLVIHQLGDTHESPPLFPLTYLLIVTMDIFCLRLFVNWLNNLIRRVISFSLKIQFKSILYTLYFHWSCSKEIAFYMYFFLNNCNFIPF